MTQISLIEQAPGEWFEDRRAYPVMKRALAGASLEESDLVGPDLADVLIYLFNWDDGLTILERWIGRRLPLKKARGYVFQAQDGRRIIPTYHPALIRRGAMELLPVLAWDLALAASDPAVPTFPREDLILQPAPRDLGEFLAVPSAWLVIDLETVGSMGDEEDVENPGMTIVRASAARDDCKAITFPWQEPFIGIFKAHVEAGHELVGFNCHDFDWPRLRENRFDLSRSHLVDVMWLRKYLAPSLPRGLGAVTTFYDRVPEWKSLSHSDEELYSALDARETAKCYIGIKDALKGRRV